MEKTHTQNEKQLGDGIWDLMQGTKVPTKYKYQLENKPIRGDRNIRYQY